MMNQSCQHFSLSHGYPMLYFSEIPIHDFYMPFANQELPGSGGMGVQEWERHPLAHVIPPLTPIAAFVLSPPHQS
jgi:hypothetical protein